MKSNSCSVISNPLYAYFFINSLTVVIIVLNSLGVFTLDVSKMEKGLRQALSAFVSLVLNHCARDSGKKGRKVA